MVNRVFGKANDFGIELEKVGDEWKGLIPANLRGEYAIELYAEDVAGNVSYMASALFIIDASTLCAHIVLLDYCAELVDTEFIATLEITDYTAEVIFPECKEGGAWND